MKHMGFLLLAMTVLVDPALRGGESVRVRRTPEAIWADLGGMILSAGYVGLGGSVNYAYTPMRFLSVTCLGAREFSFFDGNDGRMSEISIAVGAHTRTRRFHRSASIGIGTTTWKGILDDDGQRADVRLLTLPIEVETCVLLGSLGLGLKGRFHWFTEGRYGALSVFVRYTFVSSWP
ncbi:MAG: hypothetical protein JSW54_04600 [Fidelibacterota bacterium]|nr:MAG: hypothetical protein JSW54_04600 [Candidatus Neomarinimicrobiota bacterium]